ncbi:MAG TPA: DUF1127 domain-containing protein [Rhodopila sp.]
MSAHTADSQFSFKLPSLSYIDAKWEEPNLLEPSAAPQTTRRRGLVAWFSRQAAAVSTWRRDRKAALELAAMSDRDLADIGLSRSDVSRVFDPAFNQDLCHRASYS